MRAVWIIASRELSSFFDSLIAYIMIATFLGFSGFFTWLYGTDVFLNKQASLAPFFNIAYWTLFFFIPGLTMRLLAEEKKTGTIELLLTKAVSDRQVILGKFLGTFMLILIALLFTFPYVWTISVIGDPDTGELILGYVGLLLMSATYISMGIFASSMTSNQIVAFLGSLFFGLFFHVIFDNLYSNFIGAGGYILYSLSMSSHFNSIIRGVLDSRDVLYFLSIVAIGLYLSELSLSKRNLNL